MKKITLILSATFCLCAFVAKAQNIGINNTNPQAALDIQGDLRLRSAVLTLPNGLNNNVDLVTTKSSVYMFGGGALAVGGCQITGFTGGVDGRVVTIFNNSTLGAIQLYDASNGISIANSVATNRIITGTGNSAVIYGNGSVTLRYDLAKTSWTVLSSNYTDGLSTSQGWNLAGNAGTTATNFIGTTDNKDVLFKRNNVTAGIIKIDQTAFGVNALNNTVTGLDNAAFGSDVLTANTTGSNNIGVGTYTLNSNTTGNNNVGIGAAALFGNIIGNENVALGFQVLANNTASSNTAVGHQALLSNTTGFANTANGSKALYSNTTGEYNTANGDKALYSNTTGDYNTANGSNALNSNTTGINNTANGRNALYSNTTGGSNTANGRSALYSNTTGYRNAANGAEALNVNTTGYRNTANGADALYLNKTGNNNTANGWGALFFNETGNENTALGSNAGVSNGYSNLNNTVTIGYNSQTNTSGLALLGNTLSTFCGGYKGWTTYVSDARFKINVKEDVGGLDFIKALRPVTYTIDIKKLNQFIYKDKAAAYEKGLEELVTEKANHVETGFIAQEVEAAAKKVGFNFDGVKIPKDSAQTSYGMSYASFVVPLVKAVQEQQVIIENQNTIAIEQKVIIETQNKKIDNLQQQIDELKKLIMPTVKK